MKNRSDSSLWRFFAISNSSVEMGILISDMIMSDDTVLPFIYSAQSASHRRAVLGGVPAFHHSSQFFEPYFFLRRVVCLFTASIFSILSVLLPFFCIIDSDGALPCHYRLPVSGRDTMGISNRRAFQNAVDGETICPLRRPRSAAVVYILIP